MYCGAYIDIGVITATDDKTTMQYCNITENLFSIVKMLKKTSFVEGKEHAINIPSDKILYSASKCCFLKMISVVKRPTS